MKAVRLALLSVATMFATQCAASAAVFTNGSFEATSTNPANDGSVGFTNLLSGSTAIAGWTVGGGGIDWVSSSYWQPSNGSRSIDTAGLSNGSVSQTFDTLSSTTYFVGFDIAGNPQGPPPAKQLTVSVNGFDIAPFTFTNTAATTTANMGWVHYVVSFTTAAGAAGQSTTLAFTGTTNTSTQGSGPFGATLDNVTVGTAVPTPVPATALIGLVGAPMLAWARRRRAA